MSENANHLPENGVIATILWDKGMGFILPNTGGKVVFFRRGAEDFNRLRENVPVQFNRQDMSKVREKEPKRLDVALNVRQIA